VIRIARPADVPDALATKGAARRLEHEQSVRDHGAELQSGDRKLDFDNKIYAHAQVKKALLEMQNEKCAFCEAKPLHVSDGDVEHFRPKAAFRQDEKSRLERPGYYWLAYEWTNLLFSCERCNRRHKGNLFPLADAASRARSPAEDLAGEQPMFIDPSVEDPERHVAYREHVPFAVGASPRGEKTIDALGLRRRPLNDDREEHLKKLRCVFLIAEKLQDVAPKDRDDARKIIESAIVPGAEYSLMTRIAVEGWRSE
jgi:uncharacterized protein (TIGR02646 family)